MNATELRLRLSQYVVETKYVGEREIPGAPTEVAGQERHVVRRLWKFHRITHETRIRSIAA